MSDDSRPSPAATGLPAAPATERVLDRLLRRLKDEGVRHVFGIPGGLIHPFFRALEDDPGLRLIVTRHEAGATTLLAGTAVARADGVPLMLLTGRVARDIVGRGASQETSAEDVDLSAKFRPVTQYSATVSSPGRYTSTSRWNCGSRPANSSPRPRPQKPCSALDTPRCWWVPARAPPARQALRELVDLLSARAVTTPRAKGMFPEDDPASPGVLMFGTANSSKTAAQVLHWHGVQRAPVPVPLD